MTVTDNVTLTFTSPPAATNLILKIKQDATGGRAITFPASVKWPGGVTPAYSNGANEIDIYSFYFDGTDYYGSVDTNFS